ncbi:MAG: hypothetical protein AMK73_08745 [Planctomycetes bacterium SM23_32]|nr:MAG: hypothetical protein AMK73_08745 [Planctomycetes bacterium SM23_32]
MALSETLMEIYRGMREAFGHQHWWPGESPFEVMVGAILTQHTNWRNVERAILALKQEGLLSPAALAAAEPDRLQAAVRSSGYYRQKAARLRRLAAYLIEQAGGDLDLLGEVPTHELRRQLLGIRGIGPETADSILLYALERPTFVVDTYTKRVVVRHGLLDPGCTYMELKELFESCLPQDVELYKDYHAQLVRVGRLFCRSQPLCQRCPLHGLLGDPVEDEQV